MAVAKITVLTAGIASIISEVVAGDTCCTYSGRCTCVTLIRTRQAHCVSSVHGWCEAGCAVLVDAVAVVVVAEL